MIISERDTITFTSGRHIYANCGIVGISPKLELSEGFDGRIYWPPLEPIPGFPGSDPDELERQMTVEDVRELADMMIARWQRFRETLG